MINFLLLWITSGVYLVQMWSIMLILMYLYGCNNTNSTKDILID